MLNLGTKLLSFEVTINVPLGKIDTFARLLSLDRIFHDLQKLSHMYSVHLDWKGIKETPVLNTVALLQFYNTLLNI
jgi:hypothetical protein